MAIKLLSSVMESDSDVAIPGQQRHISERQSFNPALFNAGELCADSAAELHSPKWPPANSLLLSTPDSDDSSDDTFSTPRTTPSPPASIQSSEATVHVQEVSRFNSFASDPNEFVGLETTPTK